jgi:hypothetical protein
MVWVERGMVQDTYDRLRALLERNPTHEQAQAELDQLLANIEASLEVTQSRMPEIPILYRTLDGNFEALRRNLHRVTQAPNEAMQIGVYVSLCGLRAMLALASASAEHPCARLATLVQTLARMHDALHEIWMSHADQLLHRRPDLPHYPEHVVLTRCQDTGEISFILETESFP